MKKLLGSILAVAIFWVDSAFLLAQEDVSTASATEQLAFKPILPASAVLPVRTGLTEVDIEPALSRLFRASDVRGNEPQTYEELLALEEQQSKVAEKIQQVTVNVQQGTAQGSGVIITADGYVLTAAHVAGKPNRDAWILMPDGKRLKAKTLGMNRYMDAGLMKIVEPNPSGWPHASLGSSRNLKSGQWCIAAGHPGGWVRERDPVIRVGRILALVPEKSSPQGFDKLLAGNSNSDWTTIVTDCALIGGDSGGPLFDLQGKLIGIHSRIGSDVSDNMHVPIDVYSKSWDRLVQGEAWGTLPGYKPAIGVIGKADDPRAIIAKIINNSPAERAGIKEGDLIRQFDGVEIRSFAELIRAVEGTLPGDRVRVELERDGRILTYTLVVGLQEG